MAAAEALPPRAGSQFAGAGGAQFDLLLLGNHAEHLHRDRIAKPENAALALTLEKMLHRIVVVIVIAEHADVDQAIDVETLQLHKQSETGHRADDAFEFIADMIAQVFAFEPVDRLVASSVRPPLGGRARLAEFRHGGGVVGIGFPRRELLGTGRGSDASPDQAAERAMDEQVGVAPDRRSEMGVTGKAKGEMADVFRLVHGLGHRPYQQRLQHFALGAGVDLPEQAAVIGRLGLIAAAKRQAKSAQVFAQVG